MPSLQLAKDSVSADRQAGGNGGNRQPATKKAQVSDWTSVLLASPLMHCRILPRAKAKT